MSSAAGEVAQLFDAVADEYETVGPPFFDHFGALLVEGVGVSRGDRVLDLAAGSGSVSVPALAAVGAEGSLLALDLAQNMVERLGARLSVSGHPCARAVLGDAADPPVPGGAFDVVLCGFALFFLPDPPAAVRRWVGLLTPGGAVGVSTWGPEDEVFGALRDELVGLGIDARPRGQAYDDAGVLREVLDQAGLRDVTVTTVSHDLALADVDELLRWAGTHGARTWLAQLDAPARRRLREALVARWPGPVPMTWQAHLAVGTAAAD